MSDIGQQPQPVPSKWGRKLFIGMVGLNVLLVGALAFNSLHDNAATAQAQSRLPSEYLMIPGEVSGSAQAIVYVIDTTNDQLSALTFDSSGNEVRSMRPIDLSRAFGGKAAPRSQGNNTEKPGNPRPLAKHPN